MKKVVSIALIIASGVLTAYSQKTTPTPAAQSFLMAVEDAFNIAGRGIIATGTIERGTLKTGDVVELVGIKPNKATSVVSIEMFRKSLAEAKTGDNVGLLLRGVEKADVERGMVIAKPGSIKAYANVAAKIYILETAEGGPSRPIPNGARMLFEFWGKGVSGTLKLSQGMKEIALGGGTAVEIALEHPVAMETRQKFVILEGGRKIGTGQITSMWQK